MCFGGFAPAVVGVVLGFSSCVDFWGESLVCWARRSTEQLPRFPSWHISCQEHHGYNRGTCVVQPWYDWHMWAHRGTTGTLRAHRGTPGSSGSLDSSCVADITLGHV